MTATGGFLVVGIDPGVNTGVAVWNRTVRSFESIASLPIHRVMAAILSAQSAGSLHSVVFEDARQRTWFGKMDAKQAKFGAAVREGVGSVKRDCTIWHDFLDSHGIVFVAVKPASGATKWDADKFMRMTGWAGKTNEHGRDAGILVFGK